MGNPYSGEIYELAEGQRPEPGHVPLTEAEAERLKGMSLDERIRELKGMAAKRQDEMAAQRELPRFKSHKEVWALKIDAVNLDADVARNENRETDGGAWIYPVEKEYAPFKVDAAYVRKHNPQPGGYYVVYKDGYTSFSPALAFEEGYTPAGTEMAQAGPPWRDVAASAYRAYSASTSNKNFRGEQMPAWEELPSAIRTAWEAAVRQAGRVLDGGSYGLDIEQAWQGWTPPQ